MSPARKKIREIKVMFDTSVLFTKTASDLVNIGVANLINENKSHPDMKLRWYLPEIVAEERAFQMRKSGSELLPSLQKIERLLGYNLGISEATINEKIKLIISDQAESLDILIEKLNIAEVNWQNIINASVKRTPPFEDNDKEKGFRDAIIAETFLQLVNNSPRTKTQCRIVLVTGDQLLRVAVTARISDLQNAQVLGSADELKEFINTLASQVSESFVAEIQKKASSLFFTEKNEGTIYYKNKIDEKIRRDFPQEFSKIPSPANFRDTARIIIGKTRFVRKEQQRMHWVTPIEYSAMLHRFASSTPQFSPNIGTGLNINSLTSMPKSNTLQINPFQAILQPGITGLLSPTQIDPSSSEPKFFITSFQSEKQSLYPIVSTFDVHWSVTVDRQRKLTRAKVDDIAFVDTTWNASGS